MVSFEELRKRDYTFNTYLQKLNSLFDELAIV
jgi:hypothetical protein